MKKVKNRPISQTAKPMNHHYMTYSPLLSDSTISNFLILRENNRFTRIDNANVIIAVNMKFAGDIEGSM